MTTITITDAIAQGYTHFMMAKNHGDKEELYVYPLSIENLADAIKRSSDAEYDDEKAINESEHFFGEQPFLCNKAVVVSIDDDWLLDKIHDKTEDDDELSPNVMVDMFDELSQNEKFKQGIALINEAMSEYKSLTDTDIIVIP